MIGRIAERKELEKMTVSQQAELLAVIGRRRVGKTYLIREYFRDQLTFDFVGTQDADQENQLNKFAKKLATYRKNSVSWAIPKDWAEAFDQLKTWLQSLRKTKKKRVIFFDEFPWIDSHRSGFLREFTYWWNDWAAQQHILVVICGSAASWMIKKVIQNKGGLYNRITSVIDLQPFTLAEVKAYLVSLKIVLDDYQVMQLYMVLGGIPHYLKQVDVGESAAQAIERLCFMKNGPLRHEFQHLFAALFDNHERHIEVIRALHSKRKGLTRQEITATTSLSDGGGLTKLLDELTASSFIIQLPAFGKKKKETLFRLVDEYSLFYLKFIEGQRAGKRAIWQQTASSQAYTIWLGYAFENICIKHAAAIERALGIDGIRTDISSYTHKGNSTGPGVQIDMLIDRADNCINLCEMKFYNSEFPLTKDYAAAMRRRRARFVELSKTRKTVFNTLISSYGLAEPSPHAGVVDQSFSMDILFALEAF